MLGSGSLGAWPLSPTLGGGRATWGACLYPRPEEGLLGAGRPGAPAARAGAGSPKGGLISFPRVAEVSAQCLSHLFKFYGAWLAAAGLRPGEEAGAGVWEPAAAEGWPQQAGRGSGPGRPDSARASGLRAPRPVVPRDLAGRGSGLSRPKGRGLLRSARPRPFPRLLGAPHLPPPAPGVLRGGVVGGAAGRGNKSSRVRYQSWGPSRVAKSTPLASVSFPWRRGGALKSRGRVKYRNLWSLMARPGTCLEIKLGAGDEGRRGKRPLAPKGFPQEPEMTPYRGHSEGGGGRVALP